jgi:hypothetical protein
MMGPDADVPASRTPWICSVSGASLPSLTALHELTKPQDDSSMYIDILVHKKRRSTKDCRRRKNYIGNLW